MSSAIVQVDCPNCKYEILVAVKIKKRERKVNGQSSEYHKFANWAISTLFKIDPKDRNAVQAAYSRHGRYCGEIVAFAGGDSARAIEGTKAIGRWLQKTTPNWSLVAVSRWFSDWMQDPKRFE